MLKPWRIIKKILCYPEDLPTFRSHLTLVTALFLILIFFPHSPASAIPGYKKKNIIFGGDSSIPPYEFTDRNGQPAGFTVELTKAIADEIGWEANIKLGKWNEIRKELETGKIDIIQRAVYSHERSSIYEYSVPYHEFRLSFFINSADTDSFKLTRVKDLYPVAYRGGFTHEFIQKNFPGNEIKETDRLIDVFSYISSKKNSYTVLNKYLGLYLIRKYGIKDVVTTGEPLQTERYHYITLKKNSDLISALNEGLNILKVNGKFNKIYNKWFRVIENDKDESSLSIIKIIASIIIPVLLLYIIILIWSWSLRKKIKAQTSMLSEELCRHKISEKELMESEERSRLIIENAPLGIFHFDLDGKIITCNDSFIKITGLAREKIIGYDILHLSDNEISDSIRSVIGGNPGYYEGIYNSAPGVKPTHIRAMFTPIKIPGGTITGGLGIIEDNTERKKYEEALVSARDTAESANSIKSDFLANMSHEVRTPLNGILGMLQLIQTTGVNEEQANYIDVAIKSGMRLTRLLNDILDLSRVESDKLILTDTKFNIKEISDFVEERYRMECEEKNVKLFFDIEPGTPEELVGDEARIRQIILNLVSNAVKFTKSGKITVKIRSEDVSCYGAVNIIISVNDTGIGIADEMLNQIFEPFRQGENSYKRTFQGAGLGLTLVKHLVTLMNGTIKIDSSHGKGTSIECSVMVKLPENQAIALKPMLSDKINNPGSPGTILIAEDERINRLALKRILEKAGYRILEAENGIQALKILETETPECILMDIQMPEMDGIEAAKRIRDRNEFGEKSQIPIIALTAYTMPEDREKISDAGVDDYISKPVNMDYLVKTISKIISNGKS